MSYKNDGNDLFFRIVKNILTSKSMELYDEHIHDDTFEDIYTNIGVEKIISKCYDFSVVSKLIEIQPKISFITNSKHHYWYLMNILPKTFKYIDWKSK